jgi:putative flippase GtrA
MTLEKIRGKMKSFHHFERLIKYGSIGIFTTLGFFLTWNLLIFLARTNKIYLEDFDRVISFSQYFASVLWIMPSFLLNRVMTFNDLVNQNESLKKQAIKTFIIYNVSPIVASICTFIILRITPDYIQNFTLQISNFSLTLFIFFVQIVGIAINFTLNYILQYIIIYRKNKIT